MLAAATNLKNPWENTMLSTESGGKINNNGNEMNATGDVRSNGSIVINSKKASISGYAAASENVELSENASVENKY